MLRKVLVCCLFLLLFDNVFAQKNDTLLKTISNNILSVKTSLPRFLREGDNLEIVAKIANLGDKELTGQCTLELLDATTGVSVDGWFQNSFPTQYFTANAQHQEIDEDPEIWKAREKAGIDTNSFLHAFKHGTASGHLRYFFMVTDNEKGLSDYFANAAGGGLKFETAKFKGFQMGISGFFTFNIGSSDFLKRDQKTGQVSRYEIGLFDIEDPLNKTDIDRLEELYLKYNFHQSTITLGKQLINTPFINLQDGSFITVLNGLLHIGKVKGAYFGIGFNDDTFCTRHGIVSWSGHHARQ